MSKPRGTSIQKKLFAIIYETLGAEGYHIEADYSQRGGHQRAIVTRPKWAGGGTFNIQVPSTPRCDDAALGLMRQRCARILRGGC